MGLFTAQPFTGEAAASRIYTATDGATITFDLTNGERQMVTLGGNRTLVVTGDTNHQVFEIILVQDATGTRLVTWWAGIRWFGGAAPTLTTTAAKADVVRFRRIGTGAYIGEVVGQNA